MALRAKHTLDILSDKEIMEHVVRCHSIRLSRQGRSTSDLTTTSDSGGPRCLTYEELAE